VRSRDRASDSVDFTVPDIYSRHPPDKSLDIVVKLDSPDTIEESDETDNFAQARISWRWNGSIDLKDCGSLEDYFHDTTLRAYVPPLPPPPEPNLPDLIPLGLCNTADSRSAISVVVGNIGRAKGNAPVAVSARLGRDLRPISGEIPFTPWPKAVGKVGLSLDWATSRDLATARGQVSVEVDPRHLIAELDDTNNSATFEIARRADGRVDLPDCTLVDVRVEKWKAKTNAAKGP